MNYISAHLESDIHLQDRLKRYTVYFTLLVLLIALLVLAGWQWDIAFLKRPIPHLTAMNPLTAVLFVLSVASFHLLLPFRSSAAGGMSLQPSAGSREARRQSGQRRLGRLLAGLVFLLGLLRILGAIPGFPLRVDHILFAARLLHERPGNLSSQMSFNTASCFLLTGAALLLGNTGQRKRWPPAQYPALAIILIGLFSIMGYLYRVETFYGVFTYIPMAVHTAFCFLLISLSILFATPDQGILMDLTSRQTGSFSGRSLLLLIVLLPIILGYLRLVAYWAGWFSTEFGVTLLVTSFILAFSSIILYNTRLLNNRDLLKKAAENTLLESEARFRLLVSNVRDYAIFMLDPSGHIVSWNEGAQRLEGYEAHEIIGKHMSIFYRKEDLEKEEPQNNLTRARQDGHCEKEGWRVRKDGSLFWASVAFSPLYNSDGSLMGYTKLTRDMTEKRKAQEQIRYMARLMEDSSDAIFSTDPGLLIRTWNKSAEQLFGYSAAEVTGRPANEVLRSQLSAAERRDIQELLRKGNYWKGENIYLRSDDKALDIFISISGVRNEGEELEGYVMVCRDFSERKKLEKQLQQFNRQLEEQVRTQMAELTGVFERITDAFIAVDKNFCYTYLNKKAGELIHQDPTALIGKYVWDIFPDAVGSSTWHAFHQAMEEQRNIVNTDYYPPLDLWQENYLYPSPDGLSIFIRDITEKKKSEERLQISYKELQELASHLQNIREEERADIAREIHDELGQQLTGLKMDLSWLAKNMVIREEGLLQAKVRETMDLLDGTIKTVRRIATELRPSILDDLGLVAAIEWQSREFQKRSGILTEFQTAFDNFEATSSVAIGLFRICQEALTNVARHSGASHVTISLLKQDNETIALSIEDNGKGFDPAKVRQGKTLGVLGMRERTIMMGGKFDVHSTPGKGVILTITVPIN